MIYAGAALIALGNGLMWPTFMAVLSRRAGERFQGAVQGFASSSGAARQHCRPDRRRAALYLDRTVGLRLFRVHHHCGCHIDGGHRIARRARNEGKGSKTLTDSLQEQNEEMDNWRKIPWLSVGAAKEEIGALTTALDSQTDPRNRIKTARRLAYAGSSIAFSEDPLDVATIDVALAALRRARKHGAVTDDLNRSMAWLSKIRLDVTGCADFQVLAEKKKRVPVETACLAASGHENLDSEIWVGDSDVVLEAMKRGVTFSCLVF